jgi:hypothetical protein
MANTSSSDLLEELLIEADSLGLFDELKRRVDLDFVKPSRHSVRTLLDAYEHSFKQILDEKGLTLGK